MKNSLTKVSLTPNVRQNGNMQAAVETRLREITGLFFALEVTMSRFSRDFERRDDFDRRFKRSWRNAELSQSAVIGAVLGVGAYYALQEHAIGQGLGGPYSAAFVGAAVGLVFSFLARIFRR